KKTDSTGPIVLIKAAEGVSYGNLVDIVDEMAIASIARYAVVDINIVEKKMLKDALSGVNVENQN
ncbi:MAG: biopolymer transporter ExbD, partial [Bacteroidales bacterium]|nr:biopolymer transporter ExbD [Bacteroidales bacterium]